ncbi:MAG: T9SS type A sorting domain-containing protein [Gammaproteobacteria bacterium]|nr:T9SS type A sorting domain-containing protein [Gammaproteobacteria bacterium]
MKSFTFIFFMVLLNVSLFAQAPVTVWTKTFGGNLNDAGNSIQQTTDGGYIITGTTQSPSGSGWFDVWLIKTDANGDTLWTKTYGDSLGDWGHSVQQTFDGGYIIVGNTHRWRYNSDVALIKTNANGDTLWTKMFGDSLTDYGFSVQQTLEGGYVITGSTHGDGRVWLIKTNANGDTLWTNTFGDSLRNWGNSIQQTIDGGYIITGLANFFMSGNPLLIKTDVSGDTLWTKMIGEGGSESNSVQQTSDEGYIITGYITTGYNNTDVLLIKTDTNGDTLWTKTLGPGGGNSVQQTTDGGYIITGDLGRLIRTDANGDTLWTKTFQGTGHSVQLTFDGGYIITGSTDGNGSDVLLIKVAPDITSIEEKSTTALVEDYQLQQNYPNPFNPVTIINYRLATKSDVQLIIYDIAGREIKTLVNEVQNSGDHSITFDASGLASGIYIYKLKTDSFEQSRKMLLLR